MALAQTLKSHLASKAVRNVQRGYAEDEKCRGLFRPEIRMDLQRSRLMTESFKKTDGQAMVVRRAKALAHVLDNMGIFIRDWERIVGYNTSSPEGLYHPIDNNWRSVRRLVNSEDGKTLLDDGGRKELDELCAFWDGKAMSDRQQELFSEAIWPSTGNMRGPFSGAICPNWAYPITRDCSVPASKAGLQRPRIA